MRQKFLVLSVIVVALGGLTGPAVAIVDYQPNEGPSPDTGAETHFHSQSVTDRPVSGFSQISTDVDTDSNYNQENATSINDGEYTSLTAAAGDLDYYAVDVSEGEELAASIQHKGDEGEISLSIEDTNGNILSSSFDDDGTLSVGVEAGSTDGPYYIVMDSVGRDTAVEYDLRIDTGENATTSYDQRFGPNYNRDIATQLGDGEYTSLTAEAGIQDYYAVDVSEGEELAASIQHEESEGDIDLSIEDTNGNVLSSSFDDDGTVSVGVEAGSTDGPYYVLVDSTNAETDIQYDLRIETGENATTSYDRRFGPNYNRGTATQLGDGEYTSLTARERGQDYYAVDVSENDELVAAIEYSTAGELGLSIQDNNGNYLNRSFTDGGTGYTTTTVGTDETYYVIVENDGESELQYNLSINPSVSTSTPTATPTGTTKTPTTTTPQETVTIEQPPPTKTRVPTESQIEDTTERVSTVESDDAELETTSGGSGPGFTSSTTIIALLISVCIGIRRL